MISFQSIFIAVSVVVFWGDCSVVVEVVEAGTIRGQQQQTRTQLLVADNRILQTEDTGILDGEEEEEGEEAGVVSSLTPYEVFLTETCAAQVLDLNVCTDGVGGDGDGDGVDSDSESTSLSSRIEEKENYDDADDTKDNCFQCIYWLLTTIQLSDSDMDRCLEYCDYIGNTCTQEATALMNCGNHQNKEEEEEGSSATTPTAPVPDSTDPVPAAAVDPAAAPVSSSTTTTTTTTITTIGDCPETIPNSGDPCTVPTGLSYQTCDSIEGDILTRCTCRNDGARVFMCTVGSIPPPTAAPIVSPPTSATVVVPPPITLAPVLTAAPKVAAPPPVPEQTSSSLSLNNNLVPSCYVASLAADGITYTSNDDKVLPNTGDNCYVAEGLEYGNCVFARDYTPIHYYVIYRCLCNPRELPDDTYLDKFICNIILEEPYRI